MISTKMQFIFIHIPKTGGNSISTVLLPYSDEHKTVNQIYQDGIERFGLRNFLIPTVKHSTLQDYKDALKDSYYSFFKFTIVRNLWDRMISYYFSPHREVSCFNKADFIKLLRETKSQEEYITLKRKPAILNRFINPFRDLDFDFIMQFENLQQDFNQLCAILKIPQYKLPILNQSDREHYSVYYDK
jgi:hypothetical protein